MHFFMLKNEMKWKNENCHCILKLHPLKITAHNISNLSDIWTVWNMSELRCQNIWTEITYTAQVACLKHGQIHINWKAINITGQAEFIQEKKYLRYVFSLYQPTKWISDTIWIS